MKSLMIIGLSLSFAYIFLLKPLPASAAGTATVTVTVRIAPSAPSATKPKLFENITALLAKTLQTTGIINGFKLAATELYA